MFSQRTAHDPELNALTAALRARRAAGLPLSDLTQSNPTLTHLPYEAARVLGALSDPRALHYAPESFGLTSAREAVSGLQRAMGFEIGRASCRGRGEDA